MTEHNETHSCANCESFWSEKLTEDNPFPDFGCEVEEIVAITVQDTFRVNACGHFKLSKAWRRTETS